MAQINNQSPHSEYFFEFGDEAGQQQFIQWHHLRHHTYDLLQSQRGATLPPIDLTGRIDSDWLHRHAVRHSTLRKIAGTVTLNSTVGMKTLDWDNEQQVTDWLRLHALDHANLDAFFGLN